MIYVTSDWHGCELKTVKALFKKANFRENDFCFVLGGVTDGGEHGAALLEWLMEQYNVELILGANEQLLLQHAYLFETDAPPQLSAAQQALLAKWTELGALPTITALKAKKAEAREYIFEFLQDAPLYETVNVRGRDYILTHSGLGNFGKTKKLSEYTPAELLWNTPEPAERYLDGVTAVFGHTPAGELDPQSEGKVLFADTWTDVYAGPPALLRLDDGKVFYADKN